MTKFDYRFEVQEPVESGVYILSEKTITDFMPFLADLVYKVTKDGDYFVEVIKETYNKVVVVDKDYMGEGDKKLGKILLKGFLTTLRDISLKPEMILLYNEAVKISIDDEFVSILKSLVDSGTKVLLCGTCVKYFEIEPLVGEISTMFNIVGVQMNAKQVLRP